MRLLSNGLRNWKQSWKGDLRASVTVAFIAIPLNLGIGLASGVPPMAAIIPCIVGGLLVAWISGGSVTIHSTPKMIIGVTAAAVLTLGGNDPILGYRLYLAAVVAAGIIQFVLGLLRMGIIGDLVPTTVIKGLLASVGGIIILKQANVFLGLKSHGHGTLELIADLFQNAGHLNPIIASIGLISLLIMFVHPNIEFPLIKSIPAAVWVIIFSIGSSYALGMTSESSYSIFGNTFSIGPSYLIDLPDDMTQVLVQPNFDAIGTSAFWGIVFILVLVSSIEGILGATAIDRLDPLKRKSNVNKELRAVGIGTAFSGFIGGLPVAPGIVASSVAVNHGSRSLLTNIFHAILITLLTVFVGFLLRHIPLAGLAGILIHTGYKLANPKEIRNIYRIGPKQLIIFTVTFSLTLGTNLTYGILGGTLTALAFHMIRLRSVVKLFTILFRPNVVSYEEDEENKFYVSVKGYSNFLNYPRLKKALDLIPSDASIHVDLSLAEFIDHTVMEHLTEYEENHIRKGGNFEIIGMDTHLTTSQHPLSTRFKGKSSKLKLKETSLTSRQQKLMSLAKELEWGFDVSVRRYVTTFEKFHLFRYKTVDRVYNKFIGSKGISSITIQDIDFHEGELQAKVERQTTLALIRVNRTIPLFTIEKEYFFDKIAAFAGYDDIDFQDFKEFSDNFHLRGENEELIRKFMKPKLLEFLQNQLPYRMESVGDSILILGKDRPMSENEIRDLAKFAKELARLISKNET